MYKVILLLFPVFLLTSITYAYEASDYYQQGQFYYKQGDYERAISEYQKVIELEPDFPGSYHYLGICYTKSFRFGRAAYYYNKALELYRKQGNDEGIKRIKKAQHNLSFYMFYRKITVVGIVFLGLVVLLTLLGLLMKNIFILRYGEKRYFFIMSNLKAFVLFLMLLIFIYFHPYFRYQNFSLKWWVSVFVGIIFFNKEPYIVFSYSQGRKGKYSIIFFTRPKVKRQFIKEPMSGIPAAKRRG